MNTSVLVVVGLFFIIGITVGIVAVVAVANLRSDRRGGLDSPPADEPGGPGQQPPDPGYLDAESDDRPRWPGDADSGYEGG
jgi:hypothetical protein